MFLGIPADLDIRGFIQSYVEDVLTAEATLSQILNESRW